MNSDELQQFVCDTLEDIKAKDIEVIDIRKMTTMADYIVVASGTSGRHVSSVADRLVVAAKEAGTKPLGVEGKEGSEWVLVDLNDVIVHIMQPAVRDFYKLEDLWSMRPTTIAENPNA